MAYLDLTHLTPDEARAEYRRLSEQSQSQSQSKRPSKYAARPTVYQGQRYDSQAEATRAAELDRLKAAGEIVDWRRGTPWVLLEGKTRAERVTYTPDFHVWTDGSVAPPQFVEDVKGGPLLPVFRLKAKLFKAKYPLVPLIVVRADGRQERL